VLAASGDPVAAELISALPKPHDILTRYKAAEGRTDSGEMALVDERSHALGRELQLSRHDAHR
jgi:hypothetical protein